MRQIQRLQERYQNAPPGQPKGAAGGRLPVGSGTAAPHADGRLP